MLTLQNIETSAGENYQYISISTTYHMHPTSSQNADFQYYSMFTLFYYLSHSFILYFFLDVKDRNPKKAVSFLEKSCTVRKAVSSPISSFL
jgi:hypothetical protein